MSIRPVLQTQAAECGLACLAMIASAHEMPHDLPSLRRRFPISLKGATLKQLIAYAGAIDLGARALRCEVHEVRELKLPCILHWDMRHFVVLVKVTRNYAVVYDPALGERKLTVEQFSRSFTGVALELTPTADFKESKPLPRLSIRRLTGRVQGLGPAMLAIFLVALVLELFAIGAPLLQQSVIDQALVSGDMPLLNVLVLGMALLMISQTAIHLARGWMVMVLGFTLSLQWVSNLFAHLIKLPVGWFEQRHLGDITSRFQSVHDIQDTITKGMIEAVLDGIMVIAAGVLMVMYSPAMAGVVLAATLLYGAVRWASYAPLRNASAERLVLAAREQTHFLESLRAIQPLKLFGREEERRGQWQNLVVDVQNRDVRTAKMMLGFDTANRLIFGLENVLVLWLGARLVMDSGSSSTATVFTVGMLFAFISYKMQFTQRISSLIDFLIQYRMLGLHAERLADIALTDREESSTDAPPLRTDLAESDKTLELKNVSFRYGEADGWVLRNVNLSIPFGQSLVLIGPSGSGKSTLVKLLMGILPPTEGEVLLGGVPIQRLGLANTRRLLGTVLQDDVLLTGTIADNITFFDPEPNLLWLETCIEMAQLAPDIQRMPMGYHSLVGDLGAGLSGGQKQRILLARALYKRPSILVMDEATSALDVANERAFAAAISQMHLTRVIVAHRPETIAAAERKVLVCEGQVLELVSAAEVAVQPPAGAEQPVLVTQQA